MMSLKVTKPRKSIIPSTRKIFNLLLYFLMLILKQKCTREIKNTIFCWEQWFIICVTITEVLKSLQIKLVMILILRQMELTLYYHRYYRENFV